MNNHDTRKHIVHGSKGYIVGGIGALALILLLNPPIFILAEKNLFILVVIALIAIVCLFFLFKRISIFAALGLVSFLLSFFLFTIILAIELFIHPPVESG